ncbi:unnamed protein product [Brassicogethes aeneus]|uniref:Death domain-containing protein n=1 Tax=Brassicogethes aeneus TaxID=1431903 RepID=A0A9P0BFH7_BRAAE|nr:unnamed protein product [Brassicogethes aeneus]
MNILDDNNLTTDAMPSPPRDENQENNEKRENNDKQSESNECFEEEPIKQNRTGRDNPRNCSSNIMVNISNSNHVHVGSNTTIVLNKKEAKKKYQMTDSVRRLMENRKPVSKSDISFLATHIGDGWKNTARNLDYSEGQINQLYIDNHSHGVREVIYQFLLDWIQNEPEKATVSKLALTLWEADEKDAVNRWSKELV